MFSKYVFLAMAIPESMIEKSAGANILWLWRTSSDHSTHIRGGRHYRDEAGTARPRYDGPLVASEGRDEHAAGLSGREQCK